MDKNWYFGFEGEVEGPLTLQQVEELAREKRDGMVWDPQLSRWQEADEVFAQYLLQTADGTAHNMAGSHASLAKLDTDDEGESSELPAAANQSHSAGMLNNNYSTSHSPQASIDHGKPPESELSISESSVSQHSASESLATKASVSVAYQQYLVAKEMCMFARQLLMMEKKQAKEKLHLLRQVVMEQSTRVKQAKRKLEAIETKAKIKTMSHPGAANHTEETSQTEADNKSEQLIVEKMELEDSIKKGVETSMVASSENPSLSDLSATLDKILQMSNQKTDRKHKQGTGQTTGEKLSQTYGQERTQELGQKPSPKSPLKILPNICQVVTQPEWQASTVLPSESDSTVTPRDFDAPEPVGQSSDQIQMQRASFSEHCSTESNVKSSLVIRNSLTLGDGDKIEKIDAQNTLPSNEDSSSRMMRRRRRRGRY